MASRKRKNRKRQQRTGASTRAAALLERLDQTEDPNARRRAVQRLKKLRRNKRGALQGDLRTRIRDVMRERRQAEAEAGDDARARQMRRKARRKAKRQGVTVQQGKTETTREKKTARIRSQARRLLRRFDRAPKKKRKAIARKLQQLVAQYGAVLDDGLVQRIRGAIESTMQSPVDSTTPDAGTETFDEGELYDDGTTFPDGYDFGIDWPGSPDDFDPSILGPMLPDLLERAEDLEDLLKLGKKAGKKKFKQVWKKVKIQFGDNLTAKGKSSIATEGSQAASMGNKGRFIGPDSLASFGRSRFVGPDSLASFGRGRTVGPGSLAEFGKGGLKFKPRGAEGEFDDLLPFLDAGGGYDDLMLDDGLYDDLLATEGLPDDWDLYDPYLDDFGYAEPYLPSTFTELVDVNELFDDPAPMSWTEFEDSDFMLPEHEIRNLDTYSSIFDQPQDEFDSMGWFVPTDHADSFQSGGTWDYFNDIDFEAPTEDDLLYETWGPTLDEEELLLDYNNPLQGPMVLNEDDAWEGLELLEDQLGDLGNMLQTRLIPTVRQMSADARRTGDPTMLGRSRAARAALHSACRDYRRGLADCQALRQEGLGFVGKLIGPAVRLAGKYVLGATAGVVGTIAATGGAGVYAAGKKIGESAGTGLKWGLSIGLPVMVTLLAADRAGLLKSR